MLFAFYIVRGVTVVILGDSISASGGPGTKAIVFVISGLLILSYLKGYCSSALPKSRRCCAGWPRTTR